LLGLLILEVDGAPWLLLHCGLPLSTFDHPTRALCFQFESAFLMALPSRLGLFEFLFLLGCFWPLLLLGHKILVVLPGVVRHLLLLTHLLLLERLRGFGPLACLFGQLCLCRFLGGLLVCRTLLLEQLFSYDLLGKLFGSLLLLTEIALCLLLLWCCIKLILFLRRDLYDTLPGLPSLFELFAQQRSLAQLEVAVGVFVRVQQSLLLPLQCLLRELFEGPRVHQLPWRWQV